MGPPDATSHTFRACPGPRGFGSRRRGCASHYPSDDGERLVHRLVRQEVMATCPPTVRLSCQAGGAATGQPLLLHWGVSDRRGGSWRSPFDELQSVPPGSRAPDAQSCESALEGGTRVIEFAPERAGVTCMTMLIRTENCQEWLRDIDGGDVFIDVSPALDAVRSAGQGGSPPAPTQSPPPGVGSSAGARREGVNGQQQQQHHHHQNPLPRLRLPPPPPLLPRRRAITWR